MRSRRAQDAYDIERDRPTRAQLNASISQLSAQQRQRWEEDANWQQGELDARPGQRPVAQYLAMAHDNILAQLRGHDALAFLDPRKGPERNLGLLDCYLSHLSRCRTPTERARAAQCAELAAHYLVKTDWFEHPPLQKLAHVANKLSKHATRPPCAAALGWVAAQLSSQQGLQRIDAKTLAMFANAFAKVPSVAGCALGMRLLARRIHSPSGAPDLLWQFNGQGVSNVLNALSKWPDDDNGRRAGRCLARRIHGPDGIRNLLDAQQVSNVLNALSKWPDDDDGCKAARALARRIHGPEGIHDLVAQFNAQAVSNVLNALSKWPDDDGRKAAQALARRLHGPEGIHNLVEQFNAQEASNALNALSKWPSDDDGRKAAQALARRVHGPEGIRNLLPQFSAQAVSIVLNALSKWPDDDDGRKAAQALARRLHGPKGNHNLVEQFNAREVSNVLNALSKWPSDDDGRKVAQTLAQRLHGPEGVRDLLPRFNAQEMANALNALSKWPDDDNGRKAAQTLARRLHGSDGLRDLLPQFSEHQVSSALNALGKWPEDDDGRQAAQTLARRIHRPEGLRDLLPQFNAQQVSNALNALGKWPEDDDGRKAAQTLARRIHRPEGLRDLLPQFNAQQVSNALNALGKWPEDDDGRKAAQALARRIHSPDGLRNLLPRFNAQAMSNVLNALSKWCDDDDGRQAAQALAQRISGSEGLRDLLPQFNAQVVANVLNALSKWPENDDIVQAAVVTVQSLGRGDLAWSRLQMLDMTQIANALSRFGTAVQDASDVHALMQRSLRKLADRLDCDEDALSQADVIGIGQVLKALSSMQLLEDIDALAARAMTRLRELHAQDDFRSQNLEALGNLCAGLLPLTRSPKLRTHRVEALALLDAMHPAVDRKIQLYLRKLGPTTVHSAEPCDTRCPGLSLYLAVKAYHTASNLLSRRNVNERGAKWSAAEAKVLRARRAELKQWSQRTLQQCEAAITADLSSYSWNVIMQIEAESPLDALDLHTLAHGEEITQKFPVSTFDIGGVIDQMRHPPRPPQGDVGVMNIPIVDMRGRKTGDGETRYSILAHLTHGQVPAVWVELPGPPSAFLLARTLHHAGVPYRMDLFGGSKLKNEGLTLNGLFAQDPLIPQRSQPQRKQGQLLAVPYADTVPGTPFAKAVQALLGPNQESYTYFQRALLAAPPGVAGLDPHDHVLEGEFRVRTFADRPEGLGHPVRLKDRQGNPIQITVHDGMMLIRQEVAFKMPVFDKAHRAGLKPYGENKGAANLPPQALQHYPRNDAVAEEARAGLQRVLEQAELAGSGYDGELLFRRLTTAQLQGKAAVAVPAADDKLYLSAAKSSHIKDPGAGILVGRSPYDKPNLRAFAAEDVRIGDDDPTVKFLNQCTAMQYSFVAHEEARQDRGTARTQDLAMRFDKGVALLVPPELWPPEYADCDMLTSHKNNKTRTHGPAPVKDDTKHCIGLLQATEVFMPQSIYAVPVKAQEASDGDFDGDAGTIIGDRPQLFAHVLSIEQQRAAESQPSLKPPKTRTPAVDEQGRYRMGRGRQILSSRQGLIEKYTGLQQRFLAMPLAQQAVVAERALFGMYEGFDPQLKQSLREMLDRDDVSESELQAQLGKARQDIEQARHPVSKELSRHLLQQLLISASEPDDRDGLEPDRLSAQAQEMFPELVEIYGEASTTSERIHALLDKYPRRMEPLPMGYVPGDAKRSLGNFLSLGIKVGTDAYKSDTAVPAFSKRVGRLQRLMNEVAPESRQVDYAKGTARRLNAGTYDHQEAKLRLASNPTLAAEVMEAAGDELLKHQRLKLPRRAAPSAELPPMQPMPASEIWALARLNEPAITADVQEVLQHCAAVRRDHDKTLRSEGSVRDQLADGTNHGTGIFKAQPNVLRYVLEFDDHEYARGCKNAMLGFDTLGYAKVQVENGFTRRESMFAGVSAVFDSPQGYRFSVQFHTPQSYLVRAQTHDRRKQVQAEQLKGSPDPGRIGLLQQNLREACAAVLAPPTVSSIRTWHVDPAEELAQARRVRMAQVQRGAVASPARSVFALATQKQEKLTPALRALANGLGAQLMGNVRYSARNGRIESMQDAPFQKSVASIKDKIRRGTRSGMDQQRARHRVGDALRYVLQLPERGFVPSVESAIAKLRTQGMPLIKLKNYFVEGDDTYKGINARFTDIEGYEFEVQFHTADSLEAKVKTHLLFKKARAAQVRLHREQHKDAPNLDVQANLEREIGEYEQRMRETAADLSQPAGVAELLSRDLAMATLKEEAVAGFHTAR